MGRAVPATILTVASALLVAMLLLAPAAKAERLPVQGTLEIDGPTTLIGGNAFAADSTGILYANARVGSEGFRLATAEGRGVYVNLPTYRMTGAGSDVTEVPMGEEVLADIGLAAVGFAGDGHAAATDVRILPTAGHLGLDLRNASVLHLSPGPALPPLRSDAAYGEATAIQGHPVRPDDGTVAAFDEGTGLTGLSWADPFVAHVMGGHVLVDGGPSWPTGRWLNESRSVLGPDGSGMEVYDNRVVVVTGRSGSITWASGPAGWSAVLARLQGPFGGDISWTGVRADVRADGERVPAEPDLFHMRGDLWLEAEFGRPAQWTLSGQADFVAVDGRPTWVAPAMATGVGLAALALALFLGKGRLIVALLGTSLGRRLVKARPFGTPARRRVLEAIHVHQPARLAELSKATNLPRTVVAYHLRVLQGHDVIESRRGTGLRNVTYLLNSGSMAFAAGERPGSGAPVEAAQALAVVNSHPMRQGLYEAIRSAGPIDFTGIQARCARTAGKILPQSSASHHLGLLVRAGAVQERRVGRTKVYTIGVDSGQVRVAQYRRLLQHLQGLDVVRVLAAGPRKAEAVASTRNGHRALARLRDLGFVQYDPSARTYQLEPFLHSLARSL